MDTKNLVKPARPKTEMIVGRKEREKLSLTFEFFPAILLFGIHLALLFSAIFDYEMAHLAVIAIHANAVTMDRRVVCEKFVALHPRRKTVSTLLAD